MKTMHLGHAVDYRKSSVRSRFAIAFFAAAISATIIGGVLGLFEMQCEDAMIAKAAAPAPSTQVVEASTDAIRSTSVTEGRRS